MLTLSATQTDSVNNTLTGNRQQGENTHLGHTKDIRTATMTQKVGLRGECAGSSYPWTGSCNSLKMLEVMVDSARSSRSAPISVTTTHLWMSGRWRNIEPGEPAAAMESQNQRYGYNLVWLTLSLYFRSVKLNHKVEQNVRSSKKTSFILIMQLLF